MRWGAGTAILSGILCVIVPRTAAGEEVALRVERVELRQQHDDVQLKVFLDNNGRRDVGGLQFDLVFEPNVLGLREIEAGAAAKDADKDVHHNTLSPGRVRVLIAGLNQQTVASGPVAVCRLEIVGSELDAPRAVDLKQAIVSDLFGGSIPVDSEGGGLNIKPGAQIAVETVPLDGEGRNAATAAGAGAMFLAALCGLVLIMRKTGRRRARRGAR